MDRKLFVPFNLLLLLLLLLYVGAPVRCYLTEIEKMSRSLDEFLDGLDGTENLIEDTERDVELWQRYKFGTGVGNREELSITNITTRINPELSDTIENYQQIESDDEFFLAGSSDHVFYLYKLDVTRERTIYQENLNLSSKIRNFKLFDVPYTSQTEPKVVSTILVIICVESVHGIDMLWYRFTGEKLVRFDTWMIQKNVESLQFFHHDGQNRLLILREETRYFDKIFSPIDIYGFSITSEGPNLWITQRLNVPKIFDIHVCPSYESTIMALRREDEVVIYVYKNDENKEGLFYVQQNLTSNKLQNLICFESGYIRYLVTSGPEPALFDFFESEFHHDSYSEHIFNEIGEISWIQSIPVDNYRKESILLVQLKNSSIIVLSWKGRGFEKISLPNLALEKLDLSRVTVLPKYGFVYENKLVKISTSLGEKPKPVRDEMEKLLRTRYALAEVLQKQEFILQETEARTNKSYFANPTVTGFWNLSKIVVKTLTMDKGVSYDEFAIGTKKIGIDDFLSENNDRRDNLKDLESKIKEIKVNLANSISMDTNEVVLTGDLFIDGNFDVRGTLSLNNLTYENLNGFSRDEIIRDFTNYNEETIIEGEKTFESIDAENLHVFHVNGVPINEIKFDPVKRDYGKADFSKLTRLRVEGNLNFTTINDVDWDRLMTKVVFKSGTANIPGITVVEGDLEADNIEIERLNGLFYPEDYVSSKNRDSVLLKGDKKFDKLTVGDLEIDEKGTINGVSIDEYVTLNGERTLTKEITFENITIIESLQIDGNVTGLSDTQWTSELPLNETSIMTSDVVFANLRVTGDFKVENTLNGTNWSELDDLVSIDDREVLITGEKVFLSPVEVSSELVIEKRMINGRSIDEFVTLDTDQEFPNLEKISGNVTFGNINRRDLESLKELLTQDTNESGNAKCLVKPLVFRIAPVVDRLFFKLVNNVSSYEFMASTNRTFGKVRFENLELTNLRAREILPNSVNNENFEEFKRSRVSMTKSQVLTGDYEIDILETDALIARTIDGYSIDEMENLRISLDNFHHGITNGSITIDSLTIEGKISATSVNGKALKNLYDPDTMGMVVFPKDVYVENLIVLGSINRINFTNFVEDSVSKIDSDIVLTGKKTLEKIVCGSLKASSVNGISIDRILDPEKHQVLTGLVKINGTARVLDRFETDGKIGEISWLTIRERLKYMGNDTYTLNGEVVFTSEDVEIENLTVTETIRGVNFNDFLATVVYKDNKNLTIYGPIVFKEHVTIESSFAITETFNDLSLKYFYEHAVRIDRPLSVKSRIIFTRDIIIEGDLLVDEELEAKTIGGIDLKELHGSTVFLDRPTSIPGSVTVGNVVFETDIEIETLNDIDLSRVVTLSGDQTFGGTLRCKNIMVDKLDILGSINGLHLNGIYNDTLMLTGNQSIANHIVFDGNVRIRHNFDARLINGIDPEKMISLDGNDTLIGNFVFERPLVVDGNLRTKGPINDIDLIKWEATVVTKSFPIRQIVKGAWTIDGNVHFDKNVHGSDLLDGYNVTKFANDLHQSDANIGLIMDDVKKDLQSFCEDLRTLKDVAESQVYKYEFFDYLQVFNFDQKILSVHQYESNDLDYLLINFDSCHLDIFVFNGVEFTTVTSLSNVGLIERWLTLSFEDEIYLLTVGKYGCDKNSGNLWKIRDDKFIEHVKDLGNVTDAKKIKEDEYLLIVDGRMIHQSMLEIYQRSLSRPESYETGGKNFKFVIGSSEVLLVNREKIYEHEFLEESEKDQGLRNCFGTSDISSFRLGIYEREVFIYHDDSISEEYLFISDSNWRHHKILQTIKAQRPSSVNVLNFDGLIENFLIFVEDRRILQIYEYRGIEGFVHRESIKMKADKIFTLKIRKYTKLAKKHCIAVIHEKRLVLLEARMYGEKLDMGELYCDYSKN